MTLGYKIRKLRENKNYTQQYMADQLGISQRAYSMIESDDIKPSNEKLFIISKLMEVDLVQLVNLDLDSITFKDSRQNNGVVNNSGDDFPVNNQETINKLVSAKDEIIKLKDDKIALLEEKIQTLKQKKISSDGL